MEYKNVALHAIDVADGRMVGPGDTVDLDDDALNTPHNADLLATGQIIKAQEGSGVRGSTKTKDKEGES